MNPVAIVTRVNITDDNQLIIAKRLRLIVRRLRKKTRSANRLADPQPVWRCERFANLVGPELAATIVDSVEIGMRKGVSGVCTEPVEPSSRLDESRLLVPAADCRSTIPPSPKFDWKRPSEER
jgi:hypothetical protein